MTVTDEALASIGADAVLRLEVTDPAELAVIARGVPVTIIAVALVMVEHEVEFRDRWAAAGSDWVTRGQLLHEALFFLLTPEQAS